MRWIQFGSFAEGDQRLPGVVERHLGEADPIMRFGIAYADTCRILELEQSAPVVVLLEERLTSFEEVGLFLPRRPAAGDLCKPCRQGERDPQCRPGAAGPAGANEHAVGSCTSMAAIARRFRRMVIPTIAMTVQSRTIAEGSGAGAIWLVVRFGELVRSEERRVGKEC